MNERFQLGNDSFLQVRNSWVEGYNSGLPCLISAFAPSSLNPTSLPHLLSCAVCPEIQRNEKLNYCRHRSGSILLQDNVFCFSSRGGGGCEQPPSRWMKASEESDVRGYLVWKVAAITMGCLLRLYDDVNCLKSNYYKKAYDV